MDFQQQPTIPPKLDDIKEKDKRNKRKVTDQHEYEKMIAAKYSKPGRKPLSIGTHSKKSRKRQRQTLDDLLEAQQNVKPPPPFMIPKVFLMDMGKKRKRHHTVAGQFENAIEPTKMHRQEYDERSKPSATTSVTPKDQRLLLEQQAQERRRFAGDELFSALSPSEVLLNATDFTNKDDAEGYGDASLSSGDGKAIVEADVSKESDDKSSDESTLSSEDEIIDLSETGQFDDATLPHGGHSARELLPMSTSLVQFRAQVSTAVRLPDNLDRILPFPDRQHSYRGLQAPAVHNALAPISTSRSKYDCKMYEKYVPPLTWKELASVPKMPEVKKGSFRTKTFRENDVLLGRMVMATANSGSDKFIELARKFRMAYHHVPEEAKAALVRYLCNYVRSKNGRFLEKNVKDNYWYEVGDEEAVRKCSFTLQDYTAALVKKASGLLASPLCLQEESSWWI